MATNPTGSATGPGARTGSSKTTQAKYPKNVSSGLAQYLRSKGITPARWLKMTQKARDGWRSNYAKYVTAEKKKAAPQASLEGSRKLPATGSPSKPGGGSAVTPKTAAKPKKGGAGSAGGEDPFLDSLGFGAEEFIEDPGFFEYIPPIFLPSSERFANAVMNGWSQEVLGRSLTRDEQKKLLSVWRDAEQKRYASEVRVGRSEHAREIVAQLTPFGDTAPQKSTQAWPSNVQPELRKQLERSGVNADTWIEWTQEQRDQARRQFHQGGDLRKLASSRMESFTPYQDADFELELRDAIGAASPTEEFGVELRSAMEGLVAAIQGRVNPAAFAP